MRSDFFLKKRSHLVRPLRVARRRWEGRLAAAQNYPRCPALRRPPLLAFAWRRRPAVAAANEACPPPISSLFSGPGASPLLDPTAGSRCCPPGHGAHAVPWQRCVLFTRTRGARSLSVDEPATGRRVCGCPAPAPLVGVGRTPILQSVGRVW